MSLLIRVDDTNFDAEVLLSKAPVLVEVGAEWCGPCKRQQPILEQFADLNRNVKVCTIDSDDAPNIVTKLRVRGVPTILVFKDGIQVQMKVGLSNLSELNQLLNS